MATTTITTDQVKAAIVAPIRELLTSLGMNAGSEVTALQTQMESLFAEVEPQLQENLDAAANGDPWAANSVRMIQATIVGKLAESGAQYLIDNQNQIETTVKTALNVGFKLLIAAAIGA